MITEGEDKPQEMVDMKNESENKSDIASQLKQIRRDLVIVKAAVFALHAVIVWLLIARAFSG